VNREVKERKGRRARGGAPGVAKFASGSSSGLAGNASPRIFDKDFADCWYQQALHDRDVAGKIAAAGDFSWAVWMCQQAAEKLVKVIIIIMMGSTCRSHCAHAVQQYCTVQYRKLRFPCRTVQYL
jgi:hypothetical protein